MKKNMKDTQKKREEKRQERQEMVQAGASARMRLVTSVKRAGLAAAGLCLAAGMTGCTNLTGLIDAHDQFGCGIPGKVNCATLSETYEEQLAKEAALEKEKDAALIESLAADSLGKSKGFEQGVAAAARFQKGGKKGPSRVREHEEVIDTTAAGGRETWKKREVNGRRINAAVAALKARPLQLPARAPERVVMLWVLPWVDNEGDLHSDSRVWVRVKDAGWRIERVRSRAMNAPAPAIDP